MDNFSVIPAKNNQDECSQVQNRSQNQQNECGPMLKRCLACWWFLFGWECNLPFTPADSGRRSGSKNGKDESLSQKRFHQEAIDLWCTRYGWCWFKTYDLNKRTSTTCGCTALDWGSALRRKQVLHTEVQKQLLLCPGRSGGVPCDGNDRCFHAVIINMFQSCSCPT